jgi:transmembrane serine protease 9
MKFAGLAAATAIVSWLLVGGPASAEGTWMRAAVDAWQAKQAARVFGKDAAARMRITPKIIGGTPAPVGRWPFQVGILDASVSSNVAAQFCGGSLVAAQYVVTAAHCVDFLSSPSDIHVLTGTQSLARGGTRRNVAWFVFHPNWNPATADYDIAVIKLAQPTSGIPVVRLITRELEGLAAPGAPSMVIGWGDMAPGAAVHYAIELRQTSVPIVSRDVCNAPSSYDGAVTPRMLCAGLREGGKDTCQGDSGGPLLVSSLISGFRFQAGITSWGIGCALPNFYGVYSRVAVLSGWARNVIAGGAKMPRCNGLSGPQSIACLQASVPRG